MKYKFRAECREDIIGLMLLLSAKDVTEFKTEQLAKGLPDIEMEIEITKLDISKLRGIMRKVIDGHVMVQTVMPINEYTGERNYEL